MRSRRAIAASLALLASAATALIVVGCAPKLHWTYPQTLTQVEQTVGLAFPSGTQLVAAQLLHNPQGSELFAKLTMRAAEVSKFLRVHGFLLSDSDSSRFAVYDSAISDQDRPTWWHPDSLVHVTAGQALVSGNWLQLLAERPTKGQPDTVVYVVWFEP